MRIRIAYISILVILWSSIGMANASPKQNLYECHEADKVCVYGGTKIIDNIAVKKDCWEWRYNKICPYPSKDDCRLLEKCFYVKDMDCLLKDDNGNCVNKRKEYACPSWDEAALVKETAHYNLDNPETIKSFVCNNIPCFDGNCVDKSYSISTEMMESISKLKAFASGKVIKEKFNIFEGKAQSCKNHILNYCNCCSIKQSGWGKKLGAKCKQEEKLLSELRAKNLCVYLGKTKKKILKVTAYVSHHYCCYGSILDRVIQQHAREQLGIGFGTPQNPHCEGLTLEQMEQVDFEKIDFSEVGAAILSEMRQDIDQIPNIERLEEDIHNRIYVNGVAQTKKGDAQNE